MSIPNYAGCYSDVVGCPKLFEDLESILAVVWSKVSDVLGENSCSQQMNTYVSLPTVAVDNCNAVVVFPDGVSLQRPAINAYQMGLRRTRLRAGVLVMFDGYPTVEMLDNVPVFPGSGEQHLAARFLISLAWCVMCTLTEAIDDGSLLGENEIALDGDVLGMELLQPEGSCAGFLINLEVMRT